MVPIDFAEHHVAGEDHHLGGGLAFVGDRQRVARFVQAQAADQPAAVEVLAVGNAGVQAVAHQVIDLVDVDRPGEHAAEDARARDVCTLPDTRSATSRGFESPVVAQHVGHFALAMIARGELLRGPGRCGKLQVLDRMAERPVADVVQQRGGQEQLGILRRDGGGESLVGREPVKVFDRRQEHAQRMLLPRVVGGRVDEAHQAQLADLRQPAERGRVDQPPHARRERHIDARRNPHQPAAPRQRPSSGMS